MARLTNGVLPGSSASDLYATGSLGTGAEARDIELVWYYEISSSRPVEDAGLGLLRVSLEKATLASWSDLA